MSADRGHLRAGASPPDSAALGGHDLARGVLLPFDLDKTATAHVHRLGRRVESRLTMTAAERLPAERRRRAPED